MKERTGEEEKRGEWEEEEGREGGGRDGGSHLRAAGATVALRCSSGKNREMERGEGRKEGEGNRGCRRASGWLPWLLNGVNTACSSVGMKQGLFALFHEIFFLKKPDHN